MWLDVTLKNGYYTSGPFPKKSALLLNCVLVSRYWAEIAIPHLWNDYEAKFNHLLKAWEWMEGEDEDIFECEDWDSDSSEDMECKSKVNALQALST